MTTYYIGAGSNSDDRSSALLHALNKLRQQTTVLSLAPILETPPLLPATSPEAWYKPYLNTVFKIKWSSSPVQLLEILKNIERDCGRKLTERWAPRSLDLDILCADRDEPLQLDHLQIPHSQVLNRTFTLNPLVHLNSDLQLYKKTAIHHLRAQKKTIPYVMAILNCTPDSFSTSTAEKNTDTLTTFKKYLKQNIPFIDIGAESTRPGAHPVTSDIEIDRLRPILEYWQAQKAEYPWTQLSIDTRHTKTAAYALTHGVTVLNDVSHLQDPEMLELAHDFSHVIFMHSLTVPANSQIHLDTKTPAVEQILQWCEEKLEKWHHLPLAKLIFDPGIGFNKTPLQSLQILQNIDTLSTLPVRLLVGHSRKSFMNLWSPQPYDQRDVETLGASLFLTQKPINILRVHNPDIHQRALMSYQCLSTPL